MNKEKIAAELFRMRDREYAALQARILPTVAAERIIGVRTPALRAFARKLSSDGDKAAFLLSLPHRYFEEDQLHAFVISLEKDFDACIAETEAFLPFIGNWATCDQLSPGVFGKAPEKLLQHISAWLRSEKVYTVRFAIGMLMRHFLDGRFDPAYADMVASVRSDEYYVKMMVAWYFAAALAKQYDAVLPYLEKRKLDDWTHQKAIQKSVESGRIPPAHKDYLRTLRTHRLKIPPGEGPL